MIIEPTVGRVVWYRPSESDLESMRQYEEAQPFVAHVTYVWSNYMVNLVVFDHFGGMFTRTNMPLAQDGEPLPGVPYAQWMPYQIGQAKKHAEEK